MIKQFVTEINDDMRKLILDAIEERVIIPYKEKDIFNYKFQFLLKSCSNLANKLSR